MSKLEMISSLLTWIRLMIGHFLEGWAFFTRKIESVMSVKVCPWWRTFNMRSITCNWSRYSVPRKSWNRRLEQVSTLDFSCLRLSIFCLFFIPSLNVVLESWFWSSQDLEYALSARDIVASSRLALGGRANPGWSWEDDERCIDVHSRLNQRPVFTAINKQ